MVLWAPHTVGPTSGSRGFTVGPTCGSRGPTVVPTCGTHIVGSYGAHGGAHNPLVGLVGPQWGPYVGPVCWINPSHNPSHSRAIRQPRYFSLCGAMWGQKSPLVYSIMGSVIAHYAVCKYVRRFNPSTIYIKRVGFAEVLGCFLSICYSWSVN